ncbi:MAG: hypothetical protein ACI808_002951 [Paraglaciecola sp.]
MLFSLTIAATKECLVEKNTLHVILHFEVHPLFYVKN